MTTLLHAADYDARTKLGHHENECSYCGRKVNPATAYWLHMTTGLEIVPIDYAGEDSQGCFLIGPDCIKHYPEEARKHFEKANRTESTETSA